MSRVPFVTWAVCGALLLPAMAVAQSNSKEIMSREAASLVALLGKADAPVFEKAKACQRLAVIGSVDAIPALTALLSDAQLNQYARTALEGIPGSEVDSALREAVGKLTGRERVGVINSLGRRRDRQAVEILGKLVVDQDSDVAAAAARALGKIADGESARRLQAALEKDGTDKATIADACLIGADELLAAGNRDAALQLYDAVAKADVPKYLQVAMLRGKFRVLGAKGKDLLLQQIRSPDDEFFNAGLAASRDVPGADVTEALSAELNALPPHRQAPLIKVLGERQERPPVSLLQNLSASHSHRVQEAALTVLAKIGGPAAVETLLELALTNGAPAPLAQDLLKNLPGDDANQAILTKLPGAETDKKIVLIQLSGSRRIAAAAPAVRSALEDPNVAVRQAAITALGQLVTLNDLELLSNRALQSKDAAEAAAAREALAAAAMRMSDREACSAKLASLIPGIPLDKQVYLLELLTQLSGPKALATVVDHAQSDNDQLKDAATRLLGEWPDANAANALLEIAKSEKDAKYKVRAMRGYIRIARQLQLTDEERIAMFRTTIQVAQRDEEKQLALDILTRIPSPKTLDLAVSHLGDPALQAAAADAATKIAPKVINSDPKSVVAAMQKIVDAGVRGATGNRAKQLLAQAKGTGT